MPEAPESRPQPAADGSPADPTAGDGAMTVSVPASARPPAWDALRSALVGFGMGSADLVPGFSGGTVAIITGIYARLIANVRQGARFLSRLLRGRWAEAGRAFVELEWGFVVPLLVGLASAIVLLATFLERLLREQPVGMSALFLGLVLGATVLALRELQAPTWRHLVIGVVVAAGAFALLGLRPAYIEDPSLPMVFVGGAVAISAMILPGISGSFLLLLIGLYEAVLGAVTDRNVVLLGVFVLGCVVGLALSSTLLNWLLRHYHDLVLSALLGLMAGSARVLWPWPTDQGGVGDTRLAAPVAAEVPMALGLAVAGAVAVAVVAFVAQRTATVDAQGRFTLGD